MAKSNAQISPIYLITGFIESGKTSLIKNMLSDGKFSSGERTLIILCEEGTEEYDDKLIKRANAVIEVLDAPEELTGMLFKSLDAKYAPERVIIEYNSMWGVEALLDTQKPANWELAQMVTLIDSTTFEVYMTNMRKIMTDAPKLADLVIFNRCDERTKKSLYRRMIKAMNNSCNIIFDNIDGTSDDGVGEEDLPYDMKADIIKVDDEHFGTWYIDCMEHPERYKDKLVKVKGQAFDIDGIPKRAYVLGRFAMTCCADDVGGIGFICECAGDRPYNDEWIELTAQMRAGYSSIHRRNCVLLTQISFAPARKPDEELVYFNR